VPIPPSPPGSETQPPIDPLVYKVCHAEIVLIGHASSERVVLNESGTMLITISEMRSDLWLVPNAGADRFTLATQGGKVRISDELISYQIGSGRNYRRPWLLFLKKIPSTGTLALSDSPVAAGESLPQGDPAEHWKSLRSMVERSLARCTSQRR